MRSYYALFNRRRLPALPVRWAGWTRWNRWRRSIGLAGLLLALWAFGAGAAAGQEAKVEADAPDLVTVRMRDEAYVRGPQVLLGEIADISGGDRDFLETIEVAPAPQPGASRVFHASMITARLASNGLSREVIALEGGATVRATTLHQEVSREMLADELRMFILNEMPWDPADALVDIDIPRQDFVVPDGDLQIAWRPNPQYRWVGSGAFRCDISVDGRVQRSQYFKATVDAYTEVLIAARDIVRGDRITENHVSVEKMAVSSLPAGVCHTLEDALGQVATRTIQVGQPLIRRHLGPARLFRRNQIVSVELVRGAVRVTTRAKALADGYAGETVQCQNPETRAEFIGVVRGDGVVVVE